MRKWQKHPTLNYWFMMTAPLYKGGFRCHISGFSASYKATISRNNKEEGFGTLDSKWFDTLPEAMKWCENRANSLSL